MNNRNNPIKNFVFGAVGLFAVIFSIFAFNRCSGEQVDSPESLSHTTSSSSYSSKEESTNSSLLSNSSTNSNSPGENIPIYEEPAEVKKRDFSLINPTLDMAHDLFKSIFDELPNVSTPNIKYESKDILVYKYLMPKCPICDDQLFCEANLYTTGVLKFELVFEHNHMQNLQIDLAEVFLNYLKKDSAVLIGKNYKNDFGIVKKSDKWYFEFLGLNLPLFRSEIDIRTETLLSAFDNTLIEATMDLKGEGYDLSKKDLSDDDLKNVIPLLFYKHFGNVLVKYNAIEASQSIIDKATEDASKGAFDSAILNSTITINNNIDELNSYFKNYYILGGFKSSEFVVTSYESYQEAIDFCFVEMFKEANPDFVENNDLKFYENKLYADNGSSCEGSVKVTAALNCVNNYLSFFPFFNSWSLFPTPYAAQSGTQYYANEEGKIGCLGMLNYDSPDYWEDEYSHETSFDDYFFDWGITDAYYFILDYMVSNCYLKEAKLLYANKYNDLTKPSSTIDEDVLIKYYFAEDDLDDDLVTFYGVVDKQKMLSDKVLKMGFEINKDDNITSYTTLTYTTSVVINNTTYNDENSFYFYKELEYFLGSYKVRFFVEYDDKIEYSKWRVC